MYWLFKFCELVGALLLLAALVLAVLRCMMNENRRRGFDGTFAELFGEDTLGPPDIY